MSEDRSNYRTNQQPIPLMVDVGSVLDGSIVLVTGGTGTLGQALVQEIIARYCPRKLIIFSRSESRQAAMKEHWPETKDSPLRYFIGDVRDSGRLAEAIEGAKIVIHAAALKRVEVCERECKEAVLTNVLGTLNVAEVAKAAGVERFIFVSSDKACQASTTYGGTKYVAERLTVNMNNYRGNRAIRYSAVRYGNVLGSTGSVIHAFQSADGTVPITDARMSRFWLSPETAARFVLSSLVLMRGGEVFVPKLPSMRIVDIARAIAPANKPNYIGLRGPEKLQECLLSADEAPWVVELQDRYVLLPAMPFWSGSMWAEAKAVPEGWSYTSDRNDWVLTPEELLAMAGIPSKEIVHAG